MALKKIGIIHANRSVSSKYILTKMHVQSERLYFYLHFALDIIDGDRRKTPKTIISFK